MMTVLSIDHSNSVIYNILEGQTWTVILTVFLSLKINVSLFRFHLSLHE